MTHITSEPHDSRYNMMLDLLDHIFDMTNVVNANDILSAAFQAGCRDAKWWVSDFISFDISKQMDMKPGDLLASRQSKTFNPDLKDDSHVLDALYIYTNWVDNAFEKINRACKHGFDFEERVNALYDTVVTPKSGTVDRLHGSLEYSIQVLQNYPLVVGNDSGVYCIAQRLVDAIDNVSLKTLVAEMYAYGLDCQAKENNASYHTLIIPVYEYLLDAPLNADNGNELIDHAKSNRFIRLALTLSPPDFSSSDEVKATKGQHETYEQLLASLTDKQKQQGDEVVDEIVSEILETSEQAHKSFVNELIAVKQIADTFET